MTKVLEDGVFKELTQEEFEAQYPAPSSSSPPPSDTRRIEAIEAAVAELALKEVQSNA